MATQMRKDWLDKVAADAQRESADIDDVGERIAYLRRCWSRTQRPDDVETMAATYLAAYDEARRVACRMERTEYLCGIGE